MVGRGESRPDLFPPAEAAERTCPFLVLEQVTEGHRASGPCCWCSSSNTGGEGQQVPVVLSRSLTGLLLFPRYAEHCHGLTVQSPYSGPGTLAVTGTVTEQRAAK